MPRPQTSALSRSSDVTYGEFTAAVDAVADRWGRELAQAGETHFTTQFGARWTPEEWSEDLKRHISESKWDQWKPRYRRSIRNGLHSVPLSHDVYRDNCPTLEVLRSRVRRLPLGPGGTLIRRIVMDDLRTLTSEEAQKIQAASQADLDNVFKEAILALKDLSRSSVGMTDEWTEPVAADSTQLWDKIPRSEDSIRTISAVRAVVRLIGAMLETKHNSYRLGRRAAGSFLPSKVEFFGLCGSSVSESWNLLVAQRLSDTRKRAAITKAECTKRRKARELREDAPPASLLPELDGSRQPTSPFRPQARTPAVQMVLDIVRRYHARSSDSTGDPSKLAIDKEAAQVGRILAKVREGHESRAESIYSNTAVHWLFAGLMALDVTKLPAPAKLPKNWKQLEELFLASQPAVFDKLNPPNFDLRLLPL